MPQIMLFLLFIAFICLYFCLYWDRNVYIELEAKWEREQNWIGNGTQVGTWTEWVATRLSVPTHAACGGKLQTYIEGGLFLGPITLKVRFFVHLSWSIDMWAKINDVKLSQTVRSCVTGRPRHHITKEQVGRNYSEGAGLQRSPHPNTRERNHGILKRIHRVPQNSNILNISCLIYSLSYQCSQLS